MVLDNIFRIGVDKWYLKNINLKYPPHLKKMEFTKDESLKEGLEIRESDFLLSSFTRLTKSGDLLPEVTILTFNPNVVLDGHNIRNSREGRTIEALELIKKKLALKNIELDYSSAIVDTAEIQRNFNIMFQNVEKTLDLIFSIASRGKSKKVLGDRFERHLISSRPVESYYWTEWQNVHRAYDKTAEIKQTTDIDLTLEISRLEYKPSPYKFRKIFEDNGLKTDLYSVLNNLNLLDDMFNVFWFQALRKTFKYLENDYLKNIERGYLNYKNLQKVARKRKEKIPRGIYKWIKENYEVYDSIYLIKIIKKYDSNHLGRETQIINKIFKDKCLDILGYLSDFFSPLKSNNGEK